MLKYNIDDQKKLIVVESVVDDLLSFRQLKRRQKEAGGLLIGRHLLSGGHLVVDQITKPTWFDRRRRNFFYRTGSHNKLLYNAWKKSDMTQSLLGLWHTHPEPVPTPSPVDYNDWRTAIEKGAYEGSSLVFLIVGTQANKVWIGDKSGHFNELNQL